MRGDDWKLKGNILWFQSNEIIMPTLSHFRDLFLNKILDLRKKGQDVFQCYFDLYKPLYTV